MPSGYRAGFQTAWTDAGSGSRKALLIHCSLARHIVWEGVMAGLANSHSMTAFDMLGHGAAEPWNGKDSYQLQVSEMAADFCQEPAHIIGHSFGATVALRLAVERPELVSGLTLIEPVFFAVAAQDVPEVHARHAAAFVPFAQAIDAGDDETAAELFTAMWGNGVPWRKVPQGAKDYITERIHLIPAGAEAIEDDRSDVLGRLSNVSCPVTLIEGSDSPEIVSCIQKGLLARLPNATRHVVEGAGHMVPLTHAEKVAEIIRAAN